LQEKGNKRGVLPQNERVFQKMLAGACSSCYCLIKDWLY